MSDSRITAGQVRAEYSAAQEAHRAGRHKDAEAGYRRVVALDPGHAGAWYDLGRLVAAYGRLNEAIEAYDAAIKADPRHRNALVNLGYHLRKKAPERSLELTRRAIAVDPYFEIAHDNLGSQLRSLDHYEGAIESFQRAISLNPRFARGWLNLGTTFSILGRIGEAEHALRQSIAVAPNNGEAYFQLGTTIKLKPDDPTVEVMRSIYNSPTARDQDRMHVAFALGRICDDSGQFDEAFAYWQTGNRLKRKTIKYDLERDAALIASIKSRFSPEYVRTAAKSNVTDETPVFVVGMIRSGTTLMEQILASHPQVRGADENLWLPESVGRPRDCTFDDFNRIGQAYIARIRSAIGDEPRFIVDKLVANWLYIGEIHHALPNARIICMRRNPLDSCLSAYSCLFAEYHHYCYDMDELTGFYRLFDDMMRYWMSVLPGKIYVQSYEALLENPENAVRRILAYCDLPFDARCLEFDKSARPVRTASYQQVRSKLYTSSVGRWKNYEKHLLPWRSLLPP